MPRPRGKRRTGLSPISADGAWLWGGTAEEIHETLRVGINSQHDETRFGQMPAFGRVSDPGARGYTVALVTYVRHLAGLEQAEAEALEVGEALFAENCASCHGEDARGDSTAWRAQPDRQVFWIYRRRSRDSLPRPVFGGRQGHMPHWDDRLSPVQLRILALYVRSLSQP